MTVATTPRPPSQAPRPGRRRAPSGLDRARRREAAADILSADRERALGRLAAIDAVAPATAGSTAGELA
jgi:hypothetical protein